MDPALEEAARTTGSGILQTTLRVTIPLTTPGILLGLSLTFVTSMGLFGVPAALGIPVKIETLATTIFQVIEADSPDYNMGATLGMVVFVITLITFFIQKMMFFIAEVLKNSGQIRLFGCALLRNRLRIVVCLQPCVAIPPPPVLS